LSYPRPSQASIIKPGKTNGVSLNTGGDPKPFAWPGRLDLDRYCKKIDDKSADLEVRSFNRLTSYMVVQLNTQLAAPGKSLFLSHRQFDLGRQRVLHDTKLSGR
jgi:hypothetical protein